MAKIKRVETNEAAQLFNELNAPQAPAGKPETSDSLIALGEILGKGLAALSGNEMAVNFAKDVKGANDASRLRGFFDSLNKGENPALPANLGPEAQSQAQQMSFEQKRQRTIGILQLLQNLQGTENAQGQIDAQAENLQTAEAGQDRRQGKQLDVTERVASADRVSQEKQNAARVAATNYATTVQKNLGEEQNAQASELLGMKKFMQLMYPFGRYTPGSGGYTGTATGNPLAKIGSLLEYAQSAELGPAQRKQLDGIVLNTIQELLKGAGGAPGGADGQLSPEAIQQFLQMLGQAEE